MGEAGFPPLEPEELVCAGRALYGAHWRTELAAALGLADDTMIRAVETGVIRGPGAWRARLIALAQEAALRAMDTANALLCREEDQSSEGSDQDFPMDRAVG